MHTKTASPSAAPEILIADNLHKFYGPREALSGLSFSLKAGRILGFLGPNGAGKTTAIRILTTILEPSSGSFVVDGVSSAEPERIRRKIGVLPENLGLPKNITGVEYLTYYGQLYGQSAAAARAYAMEMLEEINLQHRARSLIGTYSHGMRQRLGIARALINQPSVVFLDEPTLGLDPRGQQELLALIQRIARDHKTGVILCSHLLWEIEGICDDVVILRSGEVIAQGTVREVVGQVQRKGVRVQVAPADIEAAQPVLEAVPGVLRVTPAGEETAGWFTLELVESSGLGAMDGGGLNNQILDALIRANISILNYGSEGGHLQDAFLQLTEEASV
jgi:ABC-2 type transport system ATP-binding protein